MKRKNKIIKDAVEDACGNLYDAVEIGGQIWMTTNLRTMKYNNGEEILRYGNSCMGSLPYFEYPYNLNCFSMDLERYGLLYNHDTIKRGVAPKGWHVPTLKEWRVLFATIANDKDCNVLFDERFPYNEETSFDAPTAKSLCSGKGWKLCEFPKTVGCKKKFNNTSGFCAEPAGYFMETTHGFNEYSYFLASDNSDVLANHFKCVVLKYTSTTPEYSNYPNVVGVSIRCVKDK